MKRDMKSHLLEMSSPHESPNLNHMNHHVLVHRGFRRVDLNFECSTVCPILPGLMGIWQKRLGKMVEHPNQSQPNPGPRADTLYLSYLGCSAESRTHSASPGLLVLSSTHSPRARWGRWAARARPPRRGCPSSWWPAESPRTRGACTCSRFASGSPRRSGLFDILRHRLPGRQRWSCLCWRCCLIWTFWAIWAICKDKKLLN